MMTVRRFYDSQLAQASFLIGAMDTGDALVVDPNRRIEQYLRAATDDGLRITHVTETHIHADFLSGARELARDAGARLLLSGEGGQDWSYDFAATDLLKDGASFEVGSVRIDVLHTPGHTPEHLAFLVTDTHAATAPMAAITGDFIFVGDVGRPDLLERAAHQAGTMDGAARTLFRSIQRFKTLPDFLQLWPGHGAGSACGKALGAVPQTTLGYERRFNWAFRAVDEQTFVDQVLAGQPEPPPYFAEMKRLNKVGPPLRSATPVPQQLPGSRLRDIIASGAIVIDTRPAADFAARHVAGTANIPLNKSFTTWAGSLVPYSEDFYLIVDHPPQGLTQAREDLAMIGLDRIAGYFAWADATTANVAVESTTAITAAQLERDLRNGTVHVVDVRSEAEWHAGHLAGAQHIPLAVLRERAAEIPTDRPIVVHCLGGTRSAIAASVLQAMGDHDVINFAGGYSEWRAAGLATTTP
jgi:hydroxyacylglutathione hydrolase